MITRHLAPTFHFHHNSFTSNSFETLHLVLVKSSFLLLFVHRWEKHWKDRWLFASLSFFLCHIFKTKDSHCSDVVYSLCEIVGEK